jgi:hypothetical protein
MADEHFDRLESFRVFIKATEEGAPVPPVNRDDLKRLHEIHDDFLTQHPDKEGTTGLDLMASVCRADANLPAVWFRHTRLSLLVKQGVLAEWQHGTALDDVVYQVAATIPMNGFQIDPEAFIRRLCYEAAA